MHKFHIQKLKGAGLKVLLLGEFSGFHAALKNGLERLGCSVTLAGKRDGFKKLNVDVCLDSDLSGLAGKLARRWLPIRNIRGFSEYDIVQYVNPFIFPNNFFPTEKFFEYIRKNNNKVFLAAAGSDSFYWREARKKLDYGPFDEHLRLDRKEQSHFLESSRARKLNETLLSMVDGVIPVMYEYQVAYEDIDSVMPLVPLPINLEEIRYQPNLIQSKLNVFHGLNRYGFKGTRLVEAAFEKLLTQHSDRLALSINGKLPLADYLPLLYKQNVVVDQMFSHSLGMNGLFAMAMGRVVIGGAEPKALKAMGASVSPIINVKPTPEHLYERIEELLVRTDSLLELGEMSRRFVEQHHCHIKVAEQYLERWTRS